MSTLQMKIRAGNVVWESYGDVYHFSTINTYLFHGGATSTQQSSPFNFLLDCYFIRVFFVLGEFFFFFCPSCIESSVSWQNFPSAQLNPLLPLSCFRKSHRAQPNDKGRKGNIYNDVRNSQSGKKRIKEDNPKELCCAEPGTRRSSINWTGLVHDRNVPSLGIQQVGLLNSSETSISHMARSSCVPSGRNCILY